MVVKVFCGEEFSEHEHEWIQFKEVYNLINDKYANTEELIYIFCNVPLSNAQIDLLILTENGPAILELKSYKGKIFGNEIGNWTVVAEDGEEIELPKNLFSQLRRQKFAFLEKLKSIRIGNFDQIDEEKLVLIKAWAYFENESSYEIDQVDRKAHAWFDVVTASNLIDKLKFINAGYLLRPKDMDSIVSGLKLKPYLVEKVESELIKEIESSKSIDEAKREEAQTITEPSIFLSKLEKDMPFSYPEPDERTKAILVETSAVKLFKQQLKILNRKFKENSGITAIIGRARSGKSQFIMNLEYTTNVKKDYKGIVVVLPLIGEETTFNYFIEKIITNESFQEKVHELGIVESSQDHTLINKVIENLQSNYGVDVGIFFAVDNIDEHMRQRGAKAISIEKDMAAFLGCFRNLTQFIKKGLCIILSLTEDGYEELKKYIADPTLKERFRIIHDPNSPGKILVLSELSESEAYLLVSSYMEYWALRNGLNLPVLEKCLVNGNNIFPFAPKALQLIIKAGSYAGHICLACSNSLNNKIDSEAKELEDLIINERDAALAISASASMFPNFPSVKPYISNLIGGSQIEEEIKKWMDNVAKVKYAMNVTKVDFKADFINYLRIIAKESHIDISYNSDVTVINPYSNITYKIDLIISFSGKNIGIIFIPTPIANIKIGKGLAVGIKNKNINNGIFIYAGKPDYDFRGKKKQGLDQELIQELRDVDLDYNSVVTFLQINEFESWGIVRANEITDSEVKIKLISWLESRILLLKKLESLTSSEPKKRIQRGLTGGDILGKGGA